MRHGSQGIIGRTFGALTRSVGAWFGQRASGDFRAWLKGLAGSLQREVSQPMRDETAVYSGIMAIAKTAASFPLRLHPIGDVTRLITSGPAYELLSRPQATMTGAQLIEQWFGHLVESGEAHVHFERGRASGKVRGLRIVGGRQMHDFRDPQTGLLAYWEYQPIGGSQRVRLMPEEIATRVKFNPYDPVRGLSPLKAAALEIRQSRDAAEFNAASLQNGMTPSGLMKFPGATREQAEEYTRYIRERHGGAENAGKILSLWGEAEYQQMAMKAADLELFEGRKMSRDSILNTLGVPPTIVALYTDAKYDVADASFEVFLVNTLAPDIRAFEDTLNLLVLPQIQPGVACYLDTNAHPVVRRLMLSKMQALSQAVRSGVPYNEAIVLFGLPLQPDKQFGDLRFFDGTMTPVSDLVGVAAPDEDEPTDEDDDGTNSHRRADAPHDRQDAGANAAAAARGAARERRIIEQLTRREMPAIAARYRALFSRWENKTLRRLKAALKRRDYQPAAALQAALSDAEIDAIVREVLLSATSEQGALRKLLDGYYPEAAKRTLRTTLAELGFAEDAIERIVTRFNKSRVFAQVMREKRVTIAGVERVTRRRITARLVNGLRKGETVQSITDDISAVLSGDRARALRIARSEAGQAVSTGRFAGQQAATPGRGKIWLTGANPRQTHIDAGNDYEKPIAMSKPFMVGGEALMYPRDSRGSAHEIVNCNCVMVTAALADEEESE